MGHSTVVNEQLFSGAQLRCWHLWRIVINHAHFNTPRGGVTLIDSQMEVFERESSDHLRRSRMERKRNIVSTSSIPAIVNAGYFNLRKTSVAIPKGRRFRTPRYVPYWEEQPFCCSSSFPLLPFRLAYSCSLLCSVLVVTRRRVQHADAERARRAADDVVGVLQILLRDHERPAAPTCQAVAAAV